MAPKLSCYHYAPCHCSITVFEMGPLGNLVGEDQFGNKYYENKELPYGAGPLGGHQDVPERSAWVCAGGARGRVRLPSIACKPGATVIGMCVGRRPPAMGDLQRQG